MHCNEKNNFNEARALAVIALALLTTATQAGTLTGGVVGIAVGDTLTLLDATKTQHKIRLWALGSNLIEVHCGENSASASAHQSIWRTLYGSWDIAKR